MLDHPHDLAYLLLRSSRWFDDALLARLQAGGWPRLTGSQSIVFANLLAAPAGTRPSDLARRMGITRQSVHQIVQPLVEAGLLEVVSDPTSRRSRLITLTTEGRRLTEAAAKELGQLEAELEDRIGPKNVAALRKILHLEWGDPPFPS